MPHEGNAPLEGAIAQSVLQPWCGGLVLLEIALQLPIGNVGAIGVPLRLLGVQEVREDVRGNTVTDRRREGVNEPPPDGRAARGWCASAYVSV